MCRPSKAPKTKQQRFKPGDQHLEKVCNGLLLFSPIPNWLVLGNLFILKQFLWGYSPSNAHSVRMNVGVKRGRIIINQ